MAKKTKTDSKIKREAIEIKLIGEVDRSLAWVLIVAIGILPLLVHVKIVDFIAPQIISGLLDTGPQAEMFAYYKWVLLICLALIAVALLVYKMLAYHYELRGSYINVPVFILVLFLLISVIAAEYKGIALLGLYNQRDGTLTYLCYMALLVVAANTTFRKGFHKHINLALGIFTVINVVIILFDFWGHNLAGYPAVLSMLIPADLQPYVQGTLNSTLNNPNYVSGLAAALFTYFFIFVLLEPKLKDCIIYLLLSIAAFVLMLAALSTSGFVSLLIVIPVIIAAAFLSQRKRQTAIMAGATLVLCLAVFLAMNAYNPVVYDETFGFLEQVVETNSGTSPAMAPQPVNRNPAGAGNDNSKDNFTLPPTDYFQLPAPGISAGTGRVYIWSETMQLIKEKPIVGYGQDTLAYYFPQNDINKIAAIDSYSTLVTKPHNMYLGMAYGAGVPALLALLALFLRHFYYTGKRLLKGEHDDEVILPTALFVFFCTYIVQWLFNDSVVGSAAIFWVLLGVGVSVNMAGDIRLQRIKA